MSELRTNKIYPRDGLPAGSNGGIIQIVRVIDNTIINVTSNTYTDIISASITPTSASNKILISTKVDSCRSYVTGNNRARLASNILRDSTTIKAVFESPQYRNLNFNSSGVEISIPIGIEYLDSPATTSAVTYKYQWAATDSVNFNTAGLEYSMTLMEVSG